MAKPITKYAKTIMHPEDIRYHLEKAFFETVNGRLGPVWLDIPLDIQGSMIKPSLLKKFTPPPENSTYNDMLKKNVSTTIELLKKSKRPILILGNGIRLSGGIPFFEECIRKIKAPIILPINSLDLVAQNHPLLIGKFGPVGQRRGNFALQSADLILSIGTSLNIASLCFDYKLVAPRAKKIMVNIDHGELTKSTFVSDVAIQADARDFIEEFLRQAKNVIFSPSQKWRQIYRMWKNKYPSITPDFLKNTTCVNSYVFFDMLSNILTTKDIVTTGIGLDAVSLYQSFKVKKGQRAFVNKNFGPMGWRLPASIGACIANKKRRSILITGDGSIQLNIQELETIKYYRLPIKIFVFNNGAYESIRATQDNLFEGRLVGADERSGVSNPNFEVLARAHDLGYEFMKNNDEIEEKIKKVLRKKGPVLCEVKISYYQKRVQKTATLKREDGTLVSRPLEDMTPFLPREKLWKNMHLFDKEKIA